MANQNLEKPRIPEGQHDKQFSMLLEVYTSYLDYYDGYSERMSTRFNILLAVNLAIAGALGAIWLSVGGSSTQRTGASILISSMGFVVSALQYAQSAQDKYISKRHRTRITRLRTMAEELAGFQELPALFGHLDETDSGQKGMIWKSPTEWRSNAISLTDVPTIISLFCIAFWLIVLVGIAIGY